jgi:SAM-dependent methyltransferase
MYLPLDRSQVLRTSNICLIPDELHRKGGKYSYAEWAHVIGIFQTLINMHSTHCRDDRSVLDVGCGTGLLAIACEPFVGSIGRYVGLDVNKDDVDFCRKHYSGHGFEFLHFDVNNPAYAPTQEMECRKWPLEANQFDLVTALSVWTHLREEHASFYLSEVGRILKPGGRAIITFFLLDESYEQTLGARKNTVSRFYNTTEDTWIFDQPSYDSRCVFHPGWARVPEHATGLTKRGLESMVAHAGLSLMHIHLGNWKQVPGIYFQDVLVFEKPVNGAV